ncbi:hypothetical protein Pelo_715 [Pelomyxa schiedti]|nr:hypothetical protein Pelo_715 [Pelomyxa schiedti]
MADIQISMSVQERAPVTVLYEEHCGAYNLIGLKFDAVVRAGETLFAPFSCLPRADDPQAERAQSAGKNVMIVPGGKYAVGHCTIGCEQFGPAWAMFMDMLAAQGLKSDTTRACYEAYVGHENNSCTLDLCEPIC